MTLLRTSRLFHRFSSQPCCTSKIGSDVAIGLRSENSATSKKQLIVRSQRQTGKRNRFLRVPVKNQTETRIGTAKIDQSLLKSLREHVNTSFPPTRQECARSYKVLRNA